MARNEKGQFKTTHGQTGTRLHSIWFDIKKRCYNENSISYERYGALGVTMCEEWKNDFQTFYNWSMNNGYTDELTIDREKNSKGYEPSNCRWVTLEVQANNKSNVKKYIFNGKCLTISEWSKIYNVPSKLIYGRLKKGFTIEKALTTPIRNNRKYTFNNESHSIAEWSRIYNINYNTLKDRLDKGFTIEEALNTKVDDRFRNKRCK